MVTRRNTPQPADLVSPADLARMRGAARSSASRFLRKHPEVMVGHKVNAAHPTVRAWLRGEAQPERQGAGGQARQAAPVPSAPDDGDPSEPGMPSRADFSAVTYRKALADAESAERRNAVRAGRLIPREYVRHHVFGTVDASLRRLLEVLPTVEETVALAVAAGTVREERVAAVERIVSRELGSVKRRIAQSLTRCEPAENPPPVADFGETSDTRAEQQTRDLADALLATLTGSAADRVVDAVAKVLARRACGQAWEPEVFDAAGLSTAARDEVVPMVAAMLRATIEAAFKNATHAKEHEDA